MEQFQGKLMREGQLVVDNITGRLTVDFDPNRQQRWSGFFTVPAGTAVQINDRFELVLSDGRSSKIHLERVNATSQGIFASFATEL